MLDFLAELVLELVLEGSVEVAGSRKAPLPVRIAAMALLLAVCLGLLALFICLAVKAFLAENLLSGTVLAVLALAWGGFILFGSVWAYRRRTRQ